MIGDHLTQRQIAFGGAVLQRCGPIVIQDLSGMRAEIVRREKLREQEGRPQKR
jgi:hypothetical protein